MIIKGNRHNNGAKLARYMMTGSYKKHERAEFGELRGFGEAENIVDAFRDIEVMAGATHAENALFHVQVRLPDGEQITREQWEQTADRVEKRLGLTGQPRAIYFHVNEKTGDRHMHIGFSLIDAETMTAKPLPFFKFRLKALARQLEQEFDITRVRNERDSPIHYAATKNEQQQAQRLGVEKDQIRNTIRVCWDRSESGQAFNNALEDEGLVLAQSERRDYVVIDHAGGLHALGKRLLGVSAAQVRAQLADLDRDDMPTLQQAREFILDLPRDRVEVLSRELSDVQRQIEAEQQYAQRDPVRTELQWLDAVAQAAIEKEKVEKQFVEPSQRINKATEASGRKKERDEAKAPAPELGKTQAEIRLARSLSPGPQSFANALEDRGFILAAVTQTDIEKDLAKLRAEWEERRQKPQSWMEHEGGYAALPPAFQASARRSFEEWQQRKGQQPDPQKPNAFKPDEYLTRVQKEWIEALGPQHQVTANTESEATKKQREDYVQFVQRQWAKGPKSQLERAEGGLAVVTPFGSVFTLTPRNTSLSREELPHYLQGIDRAPLLSVADAQAVIEDVQKHRKSEGQHRHEEWQMRQPIGATAAGIRLAYALTQNGPDFAAAIEDRGLTMAVMTEGDAERLNRWERQRLREQASAPQTEAKGQGRQRDIESYDRYQVGELVIVNQYGSVFQLTVATTGAHTKEREARLNQIDRAPLMSVTAAQGSARDYQQHQRQEWQERRNEAYRQGLNEKISPVAPPQPERKSAGLFAEAANEAAADPRSDKLRGVAAAVSDLHRRSGNEYYFDNTQETSQRFSLKTGNREAFATALEDNGLAFAKVTAEEADRSHRDAEFAKATGNYVPRYKEGEIVAVTEPGREYHREGQWKESRRVHKLDAGNAEKYLALLELDRKQLQGIEATKTILNGRAEKRTAERDAKGLERATKITDYQLSRQKTPRDPKESKSATRIMAAMPALAFGAIGKSFDIVTSIFDGILAPKLTTEQIREGERAIEKRSAEADDSADLANHTAQLAQERQQRQAEQAARDRQREFERDR
jgi:hypothetical protein